MRFIEYLTERRSHDVPKIGVVEALSKYRNDPDIYISYTDVDKLGINPTYGFETPLGIYFYPLKEMWKDITTNTIPYAGDRKWVWAVRAKDLLDLDKYTDKNMTEDVIKLTKEFKTKGNDHDFNTAYESAKYDCKRYGSVVLTRGRFIFYFTHNLTTWTGNKAVDWARILRKVLGYKGVRDTRGVIHVNEPKQAIVFSLRDLEVVEKIANIRPDTTKRIMTKSIKEFFSYIPKEQSAYHTDIIRNQQIEYRMVGSTIIMPKNAWSNISLDDFKYVLELRKENSGTVAIPVRSILDIIELNKYRIDLIKAATDTNTITLIDSMKKASDTKLQGRTTINRIEEYFEDLSRDYVSYGGYLFDIKSIIASTDLEDFKALVDMLIFQYTDFALLGQLILNMKADKEEALGYLIGHRWSRTTNGPWPAMPGVNPSVVQLIKSFKDYMGNSKSDMDFGTQVAGVAAKLLLDLINKKYVEMYYKE